MSLSEKKITNFVLPGISLGFILWSVKFIEMTSLVAFDGNRYFCLFDDAMISMRYAWNFSHGQGLVWNPGEFVEGYTNLLMVLVMSIPGLFLDKSSAVLAIQLLEVFVMLGIAFVNVRIARQLLPHVQYQGILEIVSFTVSLGYYPLIFWTLMGMETGLLTLFTLLTLLYALKYSKEQNPRMLLVMAFYTGMAFLVRNDSVLITWPAWLYVLWQTIKDDRKRYVQVIKALGVFAIFVIAQLAFRQLYYGAMLPNTYVLKMTGMPLLFRLRDGIGFLAPFLGETILLFIVPLFHLIIRFRWEKLLLISTYVLTSAYQVYTGGDPWDYWRMVSPSIPLLGILYACALSELFEHLSNRKTFGGVFQNGFVRSLSMALLTIAGLGLANLRFFPEIIFSTKPYQTEGNAIAVNAAIALNAVTTENASVGVFWAGAIPYYTERKAIDFLGKSDAYIAQLPADLSGSISWSGMQSVPGHNKYDLEYSIQTLQPTYVQNLRWGQDNVRQWARDKYIEVQYEGISLILLRESPDVFWEKVMLPE